MRKVHLEAIALLTFLMSGPSHAIDPLPLHSGFSVYFGIGTDTSTLKNNMAATSSFGSHTSDKEIGCLDDKVNSNTAGFPNLYFGLPDTFGNRRTQLFTGTSFENRFRFGSMLQTGVRQDLRNLGVFDLGYLFEIAGEVWANPYIVGQNRKETNRLSNSGRLTWDKIFGSALQFQYTYRNFDIADDNSRSFLRSPDIDAGQLNRDGELHQGEALYRFEFGEKHTIIPTFRYTREDPERNAMPSDMFDFQLSYGYEGDKIFLVVNGQAGYSEHDKHNPVFDKREEVSRYGASAIVLYKTPFGWQPVGIESWSISGSAGYFKSDSNTDFLTSEVVFTAAEMMINF